MSVSCVSSVLAIFSKSSVSLFWLSNPRKKLFFQSVKSFRTHTKARIRCFLQIKKIKKTDRVIRLFIACDLKKTPCILEEDTSVIGENGRIEDTLC